MQQSARADSKREEEKLSHRSGAENEEGQEEEEDDAGLTDQEKARCFRAFKAFDKDGNGFLEAKELRIVLRTLGQQTTEDEIYRMLAFADPEETGKMTYRQFEFVIDQMKRQQREQNDDDALGAYIALGGDEDGGGNINADELIRIIKKDFEMTIDIEKLIAEVDEDGSGEIEIDEFRTLLNAKN